ncbi:MAG: SDR family oxidoreductase, partial [Anaerolineae bacterium]|nr:SDR family oxidoreductase [Anaerolineae bacterium]
MGRLENKVALITGGALGIGRATCELFAREGATVAVTDILEREGQALAGEIAASGGRAAFWRLDVASEASVRETVKAIVERFGRIDILVNNAGLSGVDKPTHEISEEEWDAVFAVDVKGAFFCTKHVVPVMLAQGGGSIVNLSSIYGAIGSADVPPYHAAKGAVRLMTKTDAIYYARQGIRVNS